MLEFKNEETEMFTETLYHMLRRDELNLYNCKLVRSFLNMGYDLDKTSARFKKGYDEVEKVKNQAIHE